jgi:N-acetylated-alpha-linked acidic dipeptidase
MHFSTLSFLALSASLADACPHHHENWEYLDPHASIAKRGEAAPFPPVLTEDESILLNSFDSNSVSDWSYYYTHGLHLAGTNQSMAQWTVDRWNEFGVPASLASYLVFLDYPVSQSLSLSLPDGSEWTADLEEEPLKEDETTTYPNRVPSFHGYSATGDAEAEYVYVGRGQKVDFDRLRELGIELEGKIAISAYGGPFR